MNREKLKSHVFESLKEATFSEAVKISVPHVILIRGKRVKIKNKNMWANIGSAKSALRNYLDDLFYRYGNKQPERMVIYDNEKYDWKATRLAIKEAQDEWIRCNVNFVPISDYIHSLKKAGKMK